MTVGIRIEPANVRKVVEAKPSQRSLANDLQSVESESVVIYQCRFRGPTASPSSPGAQLLRQTIHQQCATGSSG